MSYNRFNLLIPGAGGHGAVNTIKAIKMIDFQGKIIATDSNPLSAGFHLADKYYIVPKATANDFIRKSIEIIKKERINIIFPTCGYDIIPYSKNKSIFSRMDVLLAMNDYDTIKLCNNKMSLYNKLKDYFPVPYTTTKFSKISLPCILKPNVGQGSKNIFLCKSKRDIDFYSVSFNNLIAQEYLQGEEYTVDGLSDFEGRYLFSVPRLRIEIQGGVCIKGKIVNDIEIQNITKQIADFLKLKGPFCMQFKRDGNNRLMLTEINPRLGGASIMATLAGANIPLYILKLASNEYIENPLVEKVDVIRYFQEIVLDQ